MKLPRIAPLTRREARVARTVRDHLDEQVLAAGSPPEGAGELFFAMTLALDEALDEYGRRSPWRKLIVPPGEYLTRLRPWLEELHAEVERRHNMLTQQRGSPPG